MAETLNEKLEKLNAQIDVWIDDEKYKKITQAFQIAVYKIKKGDNGKAKTGSLKSLVKTLFKNDEITHDLDNLWRTVLYYEEEVLPITNAKTEKGTVFKKFDNNDLDGLWAHLFFAKLLRAKIKQKGSECFTRRLDDVAAYLEKHIPQQSGDDEWRTRLTLMYLMELSATSMNWESLGYSERARRVIKDRKYSLSLSCKNCKHKKKKNSPYEFYDLWADFNIGVAYFHKGQYREAVLKFNKIIWQIQTWKGKDPNSEFLKYNNGIKLLYIPAFFSRSEVQLKL